MSPVKFLFLIAGLLTLTPWVSSAVALILGMTLALSFGNPFAVQTKKLTPRLLQFSVMGLGGAMNLEVIGRVGAQGVGYTFFGIAFTLLLGWAMGRLLRIHQDTS